MSLPHDIMRISVHVRLLTYLHRAFDISVGLMRYFVRFGLIVRLLTISVWLLAGDTVRLVPSSRPLLLLHLHPVESRSKVLAILISD